MDDSISGFLKQPTGLAVVGATGLVVGATAGALVGNAIGKSSAKRKRKKSSSKSSRKRSSVRRKKGRRTPRTAGKGKDRSTKRIRYTKNGQPYVLTRSGKAKFIKRSSASRSHRRKGGRY